MIKKLRLKFIIASMAAILIVLGITIGAINISNYVMNENEGSNALSLIIEQGTKDDERDGEIPPQQALEEPRGDKENSLMREHYFIVSINKNGEIVESNYRHIFIVEEVEGNEYALKVFNNEWTSGKYDNLRYKKETKQDGLTYVAFLDMKERMDSFNNFLVLSLSISGGAYLVLFGLILIASRMVFKPAEESYKNQKRFITNASHELKTPLTVISADLDLIEMDHGKDEWTSSIRDQVKRLTEMTNQLVILSRLEEEDSTNYPFTKFNLSALATKVSESFTSIFKKEEITYSLNAGEDIELYGNENLIGQLIAIFLDNSSKYTSGEKKCSYFVVHKIKKDKVELRFSNSISKDEEVDPNQVMERFYRSPSNKKEGSGVGLSIAQEIINLHKGKIEVEKTISDITFVITL